jgi:glycosyltransferase involved in cell wall biosynthesis
MVEAGINPRRELVIPNGGDDVRFRVLPAGEIKSFRQSLGKDADHLLLTVGNVTERKGQEVVIRALPHILKVAPKTHYLMAGLPTLKHELTELACELGVAEHVHFLGRVDADSLVKYLNCCDVFVMTSRLTKDGDCEGFGIAVVEAALCGKPAVVSANSGLAEAIIDGSTGIAVPEGDEVATANALLSLLKNPQLRHTMGKAALDLAQREQSWRTRSGEYDKLLGGLLDGFHRRSLKEVS